MFNIFDWRKDEVWLVGVVFGLIVGISFFQLRVGQMKTRDAQRKSDVELVARALRAFNEDHKYLPSATGSGEIRSCGRSGSLACDWGSGKIVDEQNVVYMEKLPIDPFSFKGWRYVYDQKRIYVTLENESDKGIRKGLTTWCGNGLQCNWYVEI